MEKLIEKVENLKEALDEDNRVLAIKKLNNQIKNNPDLQNKINEYKIHPSEELKKEIYDIVLYKNYKKAETEINILIMEINKKLKEISKKGQCN